MIEKKSIMTSGKQLDTIVYPSNKPHYCVPGCNFLWKAHGKFQSWKIKSKRKKLKKINHDPGKQLDTIVYPSNKPHYCVPGCNFLWKAHGKFQSWK